MSGPDDVARLWLYNYEQQVWRLTGTGTQDEMRTAADAVRAVTAALGEPPVTLYVSVNEPTNAPGDRETDVDAARAGQLADRARRDAVAALNALRDSDVNGEDVYAFATATFAVAAELRALRLGLVDELASVRKAVRRS